VITKKLTRPCTECGVPVELYAGRLARSASGDVFCCRKHSSAHRAVLKPRHCEQCGVVFSPKESSRRFHSPACAQLFAKATGKQHEKTCKRCGVRFMVRSLRQMHCSSSCRSGAALVAGQMMSCKQISVAVPCVISRAFEVVKRERKRLNLTAGVGLVEFDSLEAFHANNSSVELLGERFSLKELQEQGLGYVYSRIKAGWSADEALSVPVNRKRDGHATTVVSRTDFARMMKISRSEVTRWCQTKLAAASSRAGVDVAHPAVVEFVRKREGRQKHA
jgi:hypothetical protein